MDSCLRRNDRKVVIPRSLGIVVQNDKLQGLRKCGVTASAATSDHSREACRLVFLGGDFGLDFYLEVDYRPGAAAPVGSRDGRGFLGDNPCRVGDVGVGDGEAARRVVSPPSAAREVDLGPCVE